MKNVLIILFIGMILSVITAGCGSAKEGVPGTMQKSPPLLPSSGDYTFQRFIEEKEHTEYRVLYSKVPDSNIVQVKTVVELDSDSSSQDTSETINFYEEKQDGIFGYIVVSEDFPSDWSADDIKKFPKTKIIAFPLEESKEWTETIEDFNLDITYHIRSIDAEIETPADTFKDCIIIDFEEMDQEGNTLRKGSSVFAPQFGWIRHEIKEEVLKDVHKLIKINER
ncbi:hypothetical protein M3936_05610 [Sutcliffiella horikoshii]|uniref:hypothetical protein n=1 Tax=Sutcliffiella horikoshii TaxID=79883 RepID=UPI0007D098AA|nr:hypothetical protein [Sutcliffiella horikoshii]MCM3617061.1 hypothetical protein [Sutcliffiella horikoshii]